MDTKEIQEQIKQLEKNRDLLKANQVAHEGAIKALNDLLGEK